MMPEGMKKNMLHQTKPSDIQSGGQVLLFPAKAPEVQGRKITYLFSVRQVVDVLSEIQVQEMPFGPRHAEGIAEWRGRSLPVLSLEQCLGLDMTDPATMKLRTIVVRGVNRRNDHELQELYGIVKVGAAVRKLELPLACEPISKPDWIEGASYLKGIYKWEYCLLLVVDLEKILGAVCTVDSGSDSGVLL